jgi:hypothetical protein
MLTIALGMAVFLQAGATPADNKADDKSAVHVDCPPGATGEDCTADEVAVPGEAVVTPAAPAAVAPAVPAAVAAVAPAPTTFATVSFRNDVGKKLRLVEARFTMDGENLPVVLTSADPGKSYVITSRSVIPGPHVVTVRLTYRGDRGVFSYMQGYKLNVQSQQLLTAPTDRPVTFTLVGSEKKGMTVPLEKRVVVTVESGAARK